MSRPAVALALLIVVAGCAGVSVLDRPFGPDGRTLRQDIATYPEEQRAAFALAERRCTACHSIDEPFSAHVKAGAWRALVRKMARKPCAARLRDTTRRTAGSSSMTRMRAPRGVLTAADPSPGSRPESRT